MEKKALPPLVGVDRPAVSHGAVTVFGTRYDFARVYFAYMQLMDELTTAFGGSSVTVVYGNGLHWSAATKTVIREFWQYESADGVSSGQLLHLFPGFRVRAYLRGFDWLTVGTASGDGFGDKDMSKLDAVPRIILFGNEGAPPPLNGGFGMRSSLRSHIAARILRTLASPELALFGLGTEPGPLTKNAFDREQRDYKIVFPPETYVDGEGYFRVRCVRTDGSEVPHDPFGVS